MCLLSLGRSGLRQETLSTRYLPKFSRFDALGCGFETDLKAHSPVFESSDGEALSTGRYFLPKAGKVGFLVAALCRNKPGLNRIATIRGVLTVNPSLPRPHSHTWPLRPVENQPSSPRKSLRRLLSARKRSAFSRKRAKVPKSADLANNAPSAKGLPFLCTRLPRALGVLPGSYGSLRADFLPVFHIAICTKCTMT